MTLMRVRLCDVDRDLWEVDGDLLFDVEKLKDTPAGDLYALELEMDAAVASLLPLIEPRLSTLSLARRAVAFLALRQAGKTVAWADFQPMLLRTDFEQVEVADVDPPAGSSASSSESAASPDS